MNLKYDMSLYESYIKSPFIIANSENKAMLKLLNRSLSQNMLIPKNAKPISIGSTLIIVLITIGRDFWNVFNTNEYECVVYR